MRNRSHSIFVTELMVALLNRCAILVLPILTSVPKWTSHVVILAKCMTQEIEYHSQEDSRILHVSVWCSDARVSACPASTSNCTRKHTFYGKHAARWITVKSTAYNVPFTYCSSAHITMMRTLPITHNIRTVATVCCLWLVATTASRSACSHLIPTKPGWHL